MRPAQNQFLGFLGQVPARLTVEQVTCALNCQPHDVPALVAAKLLKPLGNSPANNVQFYCSLEVLVQAKDRSWLAKVTNALNQYWQRKNANRERGAGEIGGRLRLIADLDKI